MNFGLGSDLLLLLDSHVLISKVSMQILYSELSLFANIFKRESAISREIYGNCIG